MSDASCAGAHPLAAFKRFREQCPERWGQYRMLCKLIKGTSDRCLKDMCPKVLAARDELALAKKQRKEALRA